MICYGINPVTEALKSRRLPFRILIAEQKRSAAIDQIERLAGQRNVPVQRMANLNKICAARETQGVCAEIEDALYQPFDPSAMTASRIVMLDGLQDPQNFGAALRVCEGFGFRDVVFQKGNSSGVTAAAIKASAGAFFHLNVYQTGLTHAARKLQGAGYQMVVLDGDGNCNLAEVEPAVRLCVVVGSEHHGVRFVIKRQADRIARIPMTGSITSLNVASALAVALYELNRGAQQS